MTEEGNYCTDFYLVCSNALHCDVWVVCVCIVVCTVASFIGFWGSVFW